MAAGSAILSEAATPVERQEARRQTGRTPDGRSLDRFDPEAPQAQVREVESPETAVEELIRQHAKMVYRIAYAALQRHHDAEDAAQETFVRVLRHAAKLEKVEDPKPWLARIAWRVAVERSKRTRRRQEISIDESQPTASEPASPAASADQLVGEAQTGAVLRRLVAALPEKLRQPLILSAIEEMSPRAVAAALRISEAAVRSRVFRAREILREKLAAHGSR